MEKVRLVAKLWKMTTIGYLDRNGVGEEWYSEQETQLGRVLFV